MQSTKKIKKGQIEDFISDSTQTALNEKESISNKATDFSVINDTKYPSVEAVKEQLDLKLDKVTTVDVEKVYIKNADGTQGMKATSDFGGNVSTDNFNSLILGTDNKIYKEVEFTTAHKHTGVCEAAGYSFNTLPISQLRSAPTLSAGATFSSLATTTGNYFSSMRKYGVISSSVSGQMMGLTPGTEYQVNIGMGFYHSISFGVADAADVADARMSVGIISSATVSNVNPSTLTDCIMLGNDSGEANLQIMHNDNSGVCTKIDLGANFPSNTRNTDWYQFELFCKGNEDVVYYRVTRKNTGHIAVGVINSNLPVQSQLLQFHFKRGNGTNALAVRLAFGQFIRSYSN